MTYSIIIKNGTVIDGSGTAPYRADIGISGDKIKTIGNLGTSETDQIVDASNLYVTPGFVDITNHADTYFTLFSSPGQESMLMQGVTTILLGNCGESLAPIVKKESINTLERWTKTEAININWGSVKDYYKMIEKTETGVNTATLVGQETLRRNADSKEERILLLSRAMKDGAWGLSSNFSFAVQSKELENETLELLKIVKSFNGLYKIHLRDEGKYFLPAIAQVLTLARKSEVRTVISHFKAIGKNAWKDFSKALMMLRRVKEENIPVSFDVFPYLRTGSMLVSLLPNWASEGTNEEIIQKLNDKDISKQIITYLQGLTLHGDRIMIASAKHDKYIVGKTLKDIATTLDESLEYTIVKLLKDNNLNITIFGKTISARNMLAAVQESEALLASDGAGYNIKFKKHGDLVHPRSFGAFARFFHHIAPKAILTLEQTISAMSYKPALALGLSQRGLIKQGYIADIVVFHPETFKDNSTYKNPFKYASGIKSVIVGGKFAVSDGTLQNKRFGSVLKRSH